MQNTNQQAGHHQGTGYHFTATGVESDRVAADRERRNEQRSQMADERGAQAQHGVDKVAGATKEGIHKVTDTVKGMLHKEGSSSSSSSSDEEDNREKQGLNKGMQTGTGAGTNTAHPGGVVPGYSATHTASDQQHAAGNYQSKPAGGFGQM